MKTLDEIIVSRLAKSEQVLNAAELLVEAGMWDSVANRLYYSAYHAVSALLLQAGQTAKTHSGLKSRFHESFIKTGKLSMELAEIYELLYQNRHEADYGDFVFFDEADVSPLVDKTKQFLQQIRKEIEG